MAVQVQSPPRRGPLLRALQTTAGRTILGIVVVSLTLVLVVFTFYYVKYSRLIEQKLAAGPFANSSMLYASSRSVGVGDEAAPQELAWELRRAGYSETPSNRKGHYTLKAGEIEIYPGPDSFFKREDAVVKFNGNKVARIISLADNTERTEYALEPELLTNLFDKRREKRRLVHYEDIPPVLVHAVVSIEDKRFFQHSGFDPIRIVKAAYVDLRKQRYAEGASTLSQQLARQFWLDNDKTWRRKLPELLITMHLEQKLSKEKIFEYYANQVPLGQRGSFGIRGFGEASQAFFGKDITRLTLPEAALLAGLIQQPSFYNPFRWPDRAKQRRNMVLRAMHENRYISDKQFETASDAPITLTKRNMDSTDAPYFVDLVNDTLTDKFTDYDFQANTYNIYTTLDLELQRDASEAVRIGMEEVDKIIKARHRKNQPPEGDPQCALIAIDPQTGMVKAMVGGRNYGSSQLDHIMAKRQPGSSFKPFVYAAALNTGLNGAGDRTVTAATVLEDEPTTFWFNGKPYEPSNFHHEQFGSVTVRQALAHSLNIPTVHVAEKIGFGSVVDMARRAGMNLNIAPTPAVALGAYEVTPFEVAGAYTVFANKGIYTKPQLIAAIDGKSGEPIYEAKPEHRQALDPRVAFLMDSLLQEVLNSGTGAAVHARGINFPAAGKTGSSRDAWFAGFTTRLICIVWVGFDDNKDLNIEGARAALPVWAEFMRRAHEHRLYKNVGEFTAPGGIVSAQIDLSTGQLATPNCPSIRTEYFIDGTQPVETCALHGGGSSRVAGWETTQAFDSGRAIPTEQTAQPGQPGIPGQPPPPSDPSKKKGLFGKLRDILRD